MVAVGWGKKETQFHGSEGKEAAKKKETVIDRPIDDDDLSPRISWRGDGNAFATLVANGGQGKRDEAHYVDPNNPIFLLARVVRIYNRDGSLQFTGEKTSLLGNEIAWRYVLLWRVALCYSHGSDTNAPQTTGEPDRCVSACGRQDHRHFLRA